MNKTDYERRYQSKEEYWGNQISKMALRIPELFPAKMPKPKVLEIGCGEGTNAVFLARNGYNVTAFDLSKTAVEKTAQLAEKHEQKISVFVADINEFVPDQSFDIVFSSGTLQYLKPEIRHGFIDNLKQKTNDGGLHVLHTFAKKSYIATAPDAEACEFLWSTGELLSLYQDWRIETFLEEIKKCNSGDIPHEHSHNRIWAKKI